MQQTGYKQLGLLRRYAAALAFPIARDTAAQLAQRLSPTPEENAA